MIIRFLVNTFLYFFLSLTVYANVFDENIRISVALIDNNTGEIINFSSSIELINIKNNNKVTLKTAKGKKVYEINDSGQYKFTVKVDGYYTEEKLIDAESLTDLDIVEIRLKPQAGASLYLSVIDQSTQQNIPAKINIKFFSKSEDFQLDTENTEVKYDFFLDGKYTIAVTAENYFQSIKDYDLKRTEGRMDIKIPLKKSKYTSQITFINKATNEPISNGKVLIKSKNKNIVAFEGELNAGKISFEAKEGDTYTILINAEGFNVLNETFTLNNTDLKYALTANTSVRLEVFDDESGDRIEGELIIKSPKGKVIKIKSSKLSNVIFSPTEMGSHSIESNFNGYMNKIGSVNITSLNGGNTFFNLRIKKGNNDYVISVFDNFTKEPINTAKIRVFSDRNTEIQGKSLTKNSKSVRLDPDKKYFFEVMAEGYIDYTQNINDEKILNVYLTKPKRDSVESFMVKIIDDFTELPIPNAKFRIVENNKKSLDIKFDPSNKAYVVNKLDTKSLYITETYATSYKTDIDTLDFKKLPEVIRLVNQNFKKIKIIILDKYTKEKVSGNLVIDVGQKTLKIEKDLLGQTFVNLSPLYNYNSQILSPDIVPYDKPLNINEAVGNEITLYVIKKAYSVKIKINPKLNEIAKANFKADFGKSEGVQQDVKLNIQANDLSVYMEPEGIYKVELKAEGYEIFNKTFTFSDLDFKNLSYAITLSEKKPEPKPNVIAKTPDLKVNEAVKVTETIKPKLEEIKGKTMPMEGVKFAKSQTNMLPGFEQNLDKIIEHLKANPKSSIEIIGHTDADGDDQRKNLLLSEFRAKVVANYLFNKGGISSGRIKTTGKGGKEPLVPNDTEENRQKNRRIEAIITDY